MTTKMTKNNLYAVNQIFVNKFLTHSVLAEPTLPQATQLGVHFRYAYITRRDAPHYGT